MEDKLKILKDTVAREHGYLDWKEVLWEAGYINPERHNKANNCITEAMHRFAEICCKEQLELCADRVGLSYKTTILEADLATDKYKPQN